MRDFVKLYARHVDHKGSTLRSPIASAARAASVAVRSRTRNTPIANVGIATALFSDTARVPVVIGGQVSSLDGGQRGWPGWHSPHRPTNWLPGQVVAAFADGRPPGHEACRPTFKAAAILTT